MEAFFSKYRIKHFVEYNNAWSKSFFAKAGSTKANGREPKSCLG